MDEVMNEGYYFGSSMVGSSRATTSKEYMGWILIGFSKKYFFIGCYEHK